MRHGRHERFKSLKRRVGVRQPRKTLVVFCEGQRTEPEYLEALKREPAVRDIAAVDIRIEINGSRSAPLTLVRMAVDARERSIDEEGEVDEFWCVFDVEWPKNHPGLREAVNLAVRHNIKLAVSNPCFELWLALHFCDHRSFLTSKAAQKLRQLHDGQAGKGLVSTDYMPRRAQAASRAEALDTTHGKNDTSFPRNNPSSGMHLLIASVSTRPADGTS